MSPIHHPLYARFARKYRQSCTLFAIEVCGFSQRNGRPLTLQQQQLTEDILEDGARISYSSGHGPGKSSIIAVVVWWHLICFRMSHTMITAVDVAQVKAAIWKEMDICWQEIRFRFPWLTTLFALETEKAFAKDHKKSWFIEAKTAPSHRPSGISGRHAEYYLLIVEEASEVPEEIIQAARGALTGPKNRMVLLSQPLKDGGFFYDTHHALKRVNGNPQGIFRSRNFNAEESPIVSLQSIQEQLIALGGADSFHYKAKVLGIWSENRSGYLISRNALESAQTMKIDENFHQEPWGWVMTCDVGLGVGRDSSVISIGKVSGYGMSRRVETISSIEYINKDPAEFGWIIVRTADQYPDVTICIDTDGIGGETVRIVQKSDVVVQPIKWGLPPHSNLDRECYKNLRAKANVMAKHAIEQKRHRPAQNAKVLDQGSRIPFFINDRGQYQIQHKSNMLSKGIKSPDVWDTECFFHLANYIPYQDEEFPEMEQAEIDRYREKYMSDLQLET